MQSGKRASCGVSHTEMEQKKFFSVILIQSKECQKKTVETSQPPLNVLPVFIITEKKIMFNLYMRNDAACSLYTLGAI